MHQHVEGDPTVIKVHRILAGPFSSWEVDPDGMDEEEFWWVEAYVETGGVYEQMTLSTYNFESLYEIVKHMMAPTVEPYIIGET